MKKLILILLVCSKSILVIAQSDTSYVYVYRHLPVTREAIPLFIINGHIIMSGNDLNPNDITALNVLKDSATPANFKNLSQYGVITVTLKETVKIKTKSLREIKEWLDIKENIKFAVDGFYVDDESLLISTQSIAEINVFKKNAQNKLTDDVINIWTLDPASRKGHLPMSGKSTDNPVQSIYGNI